LPEAQLDRFMLNLWLDYPSFDQEVDVVRSTTSAVETTLETVMTASDLHRFQHFVRQIPVADNVIEYAVRLVGMSRPDRPEAPDFVNNYLSYGGGPRASQYLVLGAKALAVLQGRVTPLVEDIEALAIPVLRHRIVANFNAEAEGMSSVDIINRLVDHAARGR
jgi:MoxR-like ATPase